MYSHTGMQTILLNVQRMRELELLLAMKGAGQFWPVPTPLWPPDKVTLQHTSGCSTWVIAQPKL